MTRAKPDDWLDTGLTLLSTKGHDALTIDALCRALGRTKGSFYHHFADVSEFSQRLLEHWERANTLDLIAGADTSRTPTERRARLYASVRSVEMRVELAVQAWALRDPLARTVRRRVDLRRIEYLAELRRAAGVTPKEAERMAQIEYAAFVGGAQIFDLTTPAGWRGFEKANVLLIRALDGAQARDAETPL